MAVLDGGTFFFFWCNLVIQCHCNFRVWSSAMVHHRMFDSIIGCCLASKRLANYISKILWKTILQCRLPKFAALMHTFLNTAPHQSFESKVLSWWWWIEIKFIDLNSPLALFFSCCWEVLQYFPFYLANQNDISDQIDWTTCEVSEMDLHLSLPVFPFSQSHLLSYFQSLFLPCWYVHNPQVYSSILPDIFRTCTIWRMQCC